MSTLLLQTLRHVQCVAKLGERFPTEVHSYYNVNPPSTSSKGSPKKSKNELHIIAHNLQQGPSAVGPSVNPETFDAGNVQITIQHYDRDMAITITKGEEKSDEEEEVSTNKGQKKKQPIINDTAATTKSERKSPRRNSPRKK